MATLLRASCSSARLLHGSSRHFSSLLLITAVASPHRLARLLGLPTQRSRSMPHFGLRALLQRGFAKAKKSKGDEDGPVEVVPDVGPTVKAATVSQMEAAMVALSRELNKLRTGRASPGMLDHIIVDTNGVKIQLTRIAAVSVIDTQNLSVTPYDPSMLKELEHAISSSPLGLCPKQDGQRLVAAIPPLTKEHVQSLCKMVSKSAEDVKQSIRRARQKALETLKKSASDIPKDDIKRLEREIEELTKKFVKSAEDMCKMKENDIMGG